MNNNLFNGERLRMARIFRNLTVTELANNVKVKKQSISQFENGLTNPKHETISEIARVLNFPEKFFFQNRNDINVSNVFFRALSSASSIDKKTQEMKTRLIIEVYEFMCQTLELPELNLPSFDKYLDDFTDEFDYDGIAKYLREYWGINESPVRNMVNLLENNGIIVSAFDVDSDKIDAFTQVHNVNGTQRYCVVVGNNKKSAVRRNFDMAHELGHIVLHSNMQDYNSLTIEEQKKIEDEANQFASAFLLPKESFLDDLIKPTDLFFYKNMKDKWYVSMSAMIIRAKQLGKITYSEYQSLMKSMSYRKWRINEPLDDELPISCPTLFASAIEVLFENKIFNSTTFMRELSNYGLAINPADVEYLLNIPKGTLNVEVEKNVKNFILIKGKK